MKCILAVNLYKQFTYFRTEYPWGGKSPRGTEDSLPFKENPECYTEPESETLGACLRTSDYDHPQEYLKLDYQVKVKIYRLIPYIRILGEQIFLVTNEIGIQFS